MDDGVYFLHPLAMAEEALVPDELRPATNAALAWLNSTRGTQFELSGLVDTDHSLQQEPCGRFELGLVLCDGELCAREQVRVERSGKDYRFSLVEADAPDIPALLDPPVGVRTGWLQSQLAKHDFILLLFYRGRW